MTQLRLLIVFVVLVVIASHVIPSAAQEQDPDGRRIITGYYSPCLGGTDAEIFSWHSHTQDGKGDVDLSRQAFHFECQDREIYAIYGGEVWGATQRWGGLILVDDPDNDTCIIYLGMESVEVKQGEIIEIGQYLGQYLYRPHITALDAGCEAANWYDWDARDLETPIEFVEIGYVIAPDLTDHEAIAFVSENPSQERQEE